MAGERTGSKREAIFHSGFREDLSYWVETDRKIALRVLALVEAIVREPFTGIGKPEPLRHQLRGAWSRRLTPEHRVVYSVVEGRVHFLQCRYHYSR